MGPLERIRQVVEEGHRFLIVSHCEPEGDCLGSSLALHRGLEQLGRDVRTYNRDGVPAPYRFLPGADEVQTDPGDGPWDAVFVIDCGSIGRVGAALPRLLAGARLVVNVDHHLSNDRFGDVALVDPQASCSGELVHRILQALGVEVTDEMLTLLLCAIYTDTGSFRYVNTTAASLEIAAEAVRRGVLPWKVTQGMYERNPPHRLSALAKALESIEVAPCGRWSVMTITAAMLKAAGATSQDTEGFINYARSLDGVEVAILIREDGPELQKISLRSRGRINVSTIARSLGGGGHHNAAACHIPLGLAEARARIVPLVEQAITSELS